MAQSRRTSALRPWHFILIIGVLLIGTGIVVLAWMPGSLAEVGVDQNSRTALLQADSCAKHLLSAADHTLSAMQELGRLNAILGMLLLMIAWYSRKELSGR